MIPRFFVCLELLRLFRGELGVLSLLEEIDAGLLWIASLERIEPCAMHSLRFSKLSDALRIHVAPDAATFSRSESNYVALGPERFANSVDPSEAKRFIHGLRPCDALAAGSLFMESDPELTFLVVILFQPLPPLRRRRKEVRLSNFRQDS